jgi:hypothetical protein
MVLSHVQVYSEPYPFFTSDAALDEPSLAWLLARFEEKRHWIEHDSFYKAWMSDVRRPLNAGLQAALVGRMRALTATPLTQRVTLTVQRMEWGQYARPHTDRPLVGYETARLVVHLNPDWTEDDGGVLVIHADQAGQDPRLRRLPLHNRAFGFSMGPASWHEVEVMHRTRKTAVFHFWHPGNSPELAAWVAEQHRGMRFDVPETAEVAAEAEVHHPEEVTFRAGGIAWLLHRWGYSPSVVVQGYREGLLGSPSSEVVRYASWVHRLAHEDFDTAAWSKLHFSGPLPGLELTFPATPPAG